MKQNKFKKYIHGVFFDFSSRRFVVVNDFLSVITIVSILGIVLESVAGLRQYHDIFKTIEFISVFFFTLEYVARLYASKRRIHYIFSFYGIVDIVAILPTFLGLTNLTFLKSARILRILRLLRLIRLAKLLRIVNTKQHSNDLEHYSNIYNLNIKIYFISLIATVLILGSLMYVFESHQPAFSNIPLGMLWTFENILGGSISAALPQTLPGIVVGQISRFAGLALLGLLIAVVSNTLNHFLLGSTRLEEVKSDSKKLED